MFFDYLKSTRIPKANDSTWMHVSLYKKELTRSQGTMILVLLVHFASGTWFRCFIQNTELISQEHG